MAPGGRRQDVGGRGITEVTPVRHFAQCQVHSRDPGGSLPTCLPRESRMLACPEEERVWDGGKGEETFACITRPE